jgi:hypothetical protein
VADLKVVKYSKQRKDKFSLVQRKEADEERGGHQVSTKHEKIQPNVEGAVLLQSCSAPRLSEADAEANAWNASPAKNARKNAKRKKTEKACVSRK